MHRTVPAVEAAQRIEAAFATAGASDRRDAPSPERLLAPDATWPQVIRALAATDDDDLPLFGRLPA